MRVVIIGAGAAGLKAACRIRRKDENAEIIVIEKEKEFSISRCSLPYYIAGLVKREELFKTAYGVLKDKKYFNSKNIEILQAFAEEINRAKKVVKVNRNGHTEKLDYDYLIIATGAKPVIPKVEGINSIGVYTLHSPHDADQIIKRLKESENVVIVGAGLIGIECCEAFFDYDVNIILVEMMNRVLPTLLDLEMSKFVERYLKLLGIKVLTNTKVDKIINKNDEVCGVKIGNKEIECQMVLFATGFKPNVELAAKSGLEIGKTGAIRVNEYLQTTDPHVYAGGDCVENKCLITNDFVYLPSGSIANKHGRVIADNITGLKRKFEGVLRSLVLKVFDLTVGAIGINEELAKKKGFNIISAIVPFSSDKSHVYPERNPIILKVIVEKNTKRILGVQVVGTGRGDKKLDSLAVAIQSNAKISELMNLDFAYAPPYSPAVDHVNTISYVIDNKLNNLIYTIKPDEFKRKIESNDDFLIIDVRTYAEARIEKIEDKRCIHIPLEKFRESIPKLLKIPKEKEIILVCSSGYRSYEALRILISLGFVNVKSLEGGLLLFKSFQ